MTDRIAAVICTVFIIVAVRWICNEFDLDYETVVINALIYAESLRVIKEGGAR